MEVSPQGNGISFLRYCECGVTQRYLWKWDFPPGHLGQASPYPTPSVNILSLPPILLIRLEFLPISTSLPSSSPSSSARFLGLPNGLFRASLTAAFRADCLRAPADLGGGVALRSLSDTLCWLLSKPCPNHLPSSRLSCSPLHFVSINAMAVEQLA